MSGDECSRPSCESGTLAHLSHDSADYDWELRYNNDQEELEGEFKTEVPKESLSEKDENEDEEKSHRSGRTSLKEVWRAVGPYVVLLGCMFAAGFTFIASWSCNTFYGAEMPWFVGGGYGIWSLQDSQEYCQLWSVLFFAYQLDAPLRAARFLSMVAMLSSLACIALLTQIIPWGRIGSWIVAIALIYWLGDSLSVWWRFNLWATFFMLTFFLMVLVVKCFLLEHYSPQTLWKMSCRLFWLCILGSAGIFCILSSNVCMCDELTEEQLEGNGNDDVFGYSAVANEKNYVRPERCSGECVLGPTSKTAITTPFLWLFALVLSRFVNIQTFSPWSGNQAAAMEQESRIVQVQRDENNEEGNQSPEDSSCSGGRDEWKQKKRPRLGTATTMGDEDSRESSLLRNSLDSTSNPCQQNDFEETASTSAQGPLVLSTIKEHYQTSHHDTDDKEQEKLPAPDIQNQSNDHDEYENNIDSDNSNDENMEYEYDRGFHRHESSDSTIATLNIKRTPTRCRRIHHVFLVLVAGLYALVVAILMGSYFENRNAARAPDTSHNFITETVCAFHPLDPSRGFETFASKEAALVEGLEVAHCGACGQCSNPHDIQLYVDTRKTVADSAKQCSIQAVFGKDQALMECLREEIGFTQDCTGCWADNMRTTAKYCMWTCLGSMLIGLASSNNVEDANDYDWLNQCVYCDEKRSGPNFVRCSGVARRRLGIQSEFERKPQEQCQNVGFDYLESNLDEVFSLAATDDS